MIVDATFLDRSQCAMLADTAARLAVPFLVLDFHADEETLRSRISRREWTGANASEASLAVLGDQLQSQQPMSEAEMEATIGINTAESDWLDRLTSAVQRWGAAT